MVLQMMEVGPLMITMYDKTVYTYPSGAKAVGWILALSSVLCVPIVAIKTIATKPGTLRQVVPGHIVFSPLFDDNLAHSTAKLLLCKSGKTTWPTNITHAPSM